MAGGFLKKLLSFFLFACRRAEESSDLFIGPAGFFEGALGVPKICFERCCEDGGRFYGALRFDHLRLGFGERRFEFLNLHRSEKKLMNRLMTVELMTLSIQRVQKAPSR